MIENNNNEMTYKDDVRATRVGSLGSSDGHLLMQILSLGYVPKSAYARMAVVKGFIEQKDIPRTAAIKAGDEMEMAIYEHIKATNPKYESNPLWVSDVYSRKNVKLIAHPDIVLCDYEQKILYVYEVKTTMFTFEQTRQTYKWQLCVQRALADEKVKALGKGWRVVQCLAHYNTDGLNLEEGIVFDPQRLYVHAIRTHRGYESAISEAMDIVNDFLEGFTEYYPDDDVDANLLPEKVKEHFAAMTQMVIEINEREEKIKEFKEKLYTFMSEKGIKSVSNENFSITRVDPSESKTIDYKRYFEDELAIHPRKMNGVARKYAKTTKKKGFVQIRTKEKKEETKD